MLPTEKVAGEGDWLQKEGTIFSIVLKLQNKINVHYRIYQKLRNISLQLKGNLLQYLPVSEARQLREQQAAPSDSDETDWLTEWLLRWTPMKPSDWRYICIYIECRDNKWINKQIYLLLFEKSMHSFHRMGRWPNVEDIEKILYLHILYNNMKIIVM